MEDSTNIDQFLDSPELLLSLCHTVVAKLNERRKDSWLEEKEKQLNEISRTIQRLEKSGIAVPDELRSLKTGLIAELAVKDESNNSLEKLIDGFDDILKDLCVRSSRPHKEVKQLYPRKKRSNQPRTDDDTLRKEITDALKARGGRGHVQQILLDMEKKLRGKLLPRDLERRQDGQVIWRNNAQWERLRMVHEGILKIDSPKGIWELNEER